MPRRRMNTRRVPAASIPSGPLPVERADVIALGPVRAAADVVNAHPGVIASREAARMAGPTAILEHNHAASALLRRTAEHAAQLSAPF